jgi:hypothetical protein
MAGLPHYNNSKAATKLYEPIQGNLYEVTIIPPNGIDGSLLLEHVNTVGGLAAVNPSIDAVAQKYKFAEIESAELPPGLREQKGISGFPHFIARTDGQELSSPGSKTSLKELMDALHLRRSLGRRNTRRLTRRVRKTV